MKNFANGCYEHLLQSYNSIIVNKTENGSNTTKHFKQQIMSWSFQPFQKYKFLAIVEIFTYKMCVIICKNVSQKIFIYSSQYHCCLKKKNKSLHISYYSKIKLQFAIIKSSRCSPSLPLVIFSTRRYKMHKKKRNQMNSVAILKDNFVC